MALSNNRRSLSHWWWIVVTVACAALEAAAGPRHGAGSFVIDLPQPYSTVTEAVRKVASNGVMQGTKEYQRDSELAGARAVAGSTLFARWSGPGEALYKVKTGAISPAHFLDSNDTGTVAIRYVVQAVNSTTTRLAIDAVFEEDGHRRRHSSDGSVEAGEFAAVLKQLNPDEKTPPAAVAEQTSGQKPAPAGDTQITEQTEVAALSAELQRLQARVQSLENELAARSKPLPAPEQPSGPQTLNQTPSEPPALKAEPTFQVLREAVQVFQGDWRELSGKPVLYVWVLRRGVNLGVQSEARWSYASQIFLERYRQRHSPEAAGVVVIFLEPHGGIAAAKMADIGYFANGQLSASEFRNRCSLDPIPAFAAGTTRASYRQ